MGANVMVNQIIALAEKKDKELDDLMNKITETVESFSDGSVPVTEKTKALVSTEFLFTKIRTLVEFEHISVKRLLADSDVPVSVKPIFVKRDVYLSQVCTKLTAIREDINVLQKTIYMTTTYFNR